MPSAAPLCSGTGRQSGTITAWPSHLAVRQPHRPSRPFPCSGIGSLSSASAVRTACDGLARSPTTCLATVRGGRTLMHFDRLLLPYRFRLRALAPRVFPASLRGSRLAPPILALLVRTTETGGVGVSRRRLRFGERPRVRAGVFCFRASDSAVPSDAPVAARPRRFAFAKRDTSRARRDRRGGHSVKDRPTERPGTPSAASLPRPARLAPSVRMRSREFPRSPRCRCPFARGACACARRASS
jgi:hypothetical protein